MKTSATHILNPFLIPFAKFFLIFIVTFPGFTQVNKAEYFLALGGISINSSDIDQDGDTDLIVGHHAGEIIDTAVTIIYNSGNGIFSEEFSVLQFEGYQNDIFTQNINNDSLPDIVAFNFLPDAKSYFLRALFNSNGSFNQYDDYLLNDNYNRKTYGDINGDSKTDVVLSSSNGQKWGVFINNGTGQLGNPEYYDVTGYWPTDIECGKLNEDNRDDVVLTGQKTEIYFSYETGFQVSVIDDYPNLTLKIADMDNDGDNDITAVTCFGNTSVFIYENQGNGNFIKHTAGVYNEFNSYRFDVGDLDNDSLPDAVFASFDGIYVVFNNGDFSMGQPEFYPVTYPGLADGHTHCCDLNNDGYRDIAIINGSFDVYTTVLTLFYNDGSGNFIPDPPTHITEKAAALKNILNAHPNPFQTTSTIRFCLEQEEYVELMILGLDGKLARTLCNSNLEKGEHQYTWNGRDAEYSSCNPGVYLCILKTGNKLYSLKLLLKN